MDYFLSLDGGGTKTACLVADSEGHLLGAGLGGPANINFICLEIARRSLSDAVGRAWRAGGPPPHPPKVAVISGPVPDALTEEIIVQETHADNLFRVPEGQMAWRAALPWIDFDYGVAIDAGTGSVAYGFNSQGQGAQTSGWGTLLGDEGGGYWIAVEALRAAVRAEDGREPPTLLQGAVCQALGIESIPELVPLVYQEGLEQHEIAALCPVVAKVARQGDARAQAILVQAGKELALAAEGVIRKLALADDRFAIVVFGSVFRAGELILGPFREAVLRVAPRAEIIHPRYEPVVGGLFIAMQRGGVQLGGRFLAELEAGLRREPLAVGQGFSDS